MAGYDFRVPVSPEERMFARLLLRHLQQMAIFRFCGRPTNVVYRWRKPTKRVPYHNYHVVVDGDFAELQGLSTEAFSAIQHFGAGIVAAGGASSESIVPKVTAIAFYRATVEMQEDFEEIANFTVQKGLPGPLINSYLFGQSGDPQLDQKIQVLSKALVGWRNHRVAAETVLEQSHTAIELLLKTVLGAPNRVSAFSQLLEAAAHEKVLTTQERDKLNILKDKRRDAKHRSQSVGEGTLAELLPVAVGVTHRLVATLAMRHKASAG